MQEIQVHNGHEYTTDIQKQLSKILIQKHAHFVGKYVLFFKTLHHRSIFSKHNTFVHRVGHLWDRIEIMIITIFEIHPQDLLYINSQKLGLGGIPNQSQKLGLGGTQTTLRLGSTYPRCKIDIFFVQTGLSDFRRIFEQTRFRTDLE